MGKESLMRCIRRKIATVLMLVVTITQSPIAEVFGMGVLRAQALEPAEVEIYQSRTSPYKFMSFETPEYGMYFTVRSYKEIDSYQWISDGVDIPGATSDNYLVSTADIGRSLSVNVTSGGDTVCVPVGNGTVTKAIPIVSSEFEFDGSVVSLTPVVSRLATDDQAEAPTGYVEIQYCISDVVAEPVEGPEVEEVWVTLSENNAIYQTFYHTVTEDMKGKCVQYRVDYKGDDNYQAKTCPWPEILELIPPVIDSVSDVTVSGNNYTFTVRLDHTGPWESGNYYCMLTPANEAGYDHITDADVKKGAISTNEIENIFTEPPEFEISVDGSSFAPGKYVFLVVVDDYRGNLSAKVATSEFTVGGSTVYYSSSDISATINEQITYNGEEQIPSVKADAIGDNAEIVGAWLQEALAAGKVNYSFLWTANGDGGAVTDAIKKNTVKDAGTYSIFAASDDPAVVIADEALGSFTVYKAKAEAPNASPSLDITVSEDKTAYIVSVNASAVTNAYGKIMEYSFNDGKYSSETAYVAGPEEDVKASVRFAEGVNTLTSDPVSSDIITTGGRTEKPIIDGDVYFADSQDVLITASVSTDEIFYTTDGTDPAVNDHTASGIGSVVFSISSSTVVKAVAVGSDKLMSEVVTSEFTLSENVIQEESRLATAAYNSRSKRFEFSFKDAISENTLITAQIGTFNTDEGFTVKADGRAYITESGFLAMNFYGTDGKRFVAKAGEEVCLRFSIENELISLDPEYMIIEEFDTYDGITFSVSENVEQYKLDFYKYSNSAKLIATVDVDDKSIKNGCYYFTEEDLVLLDPDALYNCVVRTVSGDHVMEYSGFFCSDPLNFLDPAKKIKLRSLRITGAGAMEVGDKKQLSAEFTPADAKNSVSVNWQSSDPSVATIDDHGMVEALSVGQTTITLSCTDSGVRAVTYILQVIDKEKSLYVEFAEDEYYVYSGKKVTPPVAVYYGGKKLTEGVDYKLTYSNNINASVNNNARIKVAGITVSGTVEKEFTIRPRSIDDSAVKVAETIVESGKKPTPVLYLGTYKLTAKDYSFDKNTKFTSNGSMVVTGKGNFKGSRVIDVTVGKPLKFKVSYFKAADRTYNGQEQKLTAKELTVVDATTLAVLKEGTDYILSYQEDIRSAGTKKVSIIGIGKYNTVISKSFKINPLKATGVSVNMPLSVVYHPGTITTDVSAIYKTTDLIPNVDYTVKYNKNTKIGKAEVRVTFAGNYKGTQTIIKTFDIVKASISADNVNIYCPDLAWVKDAKYISEPNVTMDGKQISKSDYTVTYTLSGNDISKKKITKADLGKDNVAVVIVTVEGKGNMKGKATTTYRVVYSPKENDLSKAKLTIRDRNGKKVSSLPYTGTEVEFKGDYRLEVVLNGVTLKEGVDYKVEYANNINKGKATVIVTGLGETSTEKTKYYGSKRLAFTIKKGDIAWY